MRRRDRDGGSLRAPSRAPIYKASSPRAYIRLGSGAKRGTGRRVRIGKWSGGEKDFIFGSLMTFTSSRASEEERDTARNKRR
jgi:hypothetical protein